MHYVRVLCVCVCARVSFIGERNRRRAQTPHGCGNRRMTHWPSDYLPTHSHDSDAGNGSERRRRPKAVGYSTWVPVEGLRLLPLSSTTCTSCVISEQTKMSTTGKTMLLPRARYHEQPPSIRLRGRCRKTNKQSICMPDAETRGWTAGFEGPEAGSLGPQEEAY